VEFNWSRWVVCYRLDDGKELADLLIHLPCRIWKRRFKNRTNWFIWNWKSIGESCVINAIILALILNRIISNLWRPISIGRGLKGCWSYGLNCATRGCNLPRNFESERIKLGLFHWVLEGFQCRWNALQQTKVDTWHPTSNVTQRSIDEMMFDIICHCLLYSNPLFHSYSKSAVPLENVLTAPLCRIWYYHRIPLNLSSWEVFSFILLIWKFTISGRCQQPYFGFLFFFFHPQQQFIVKFMLNIYSRFYQSSESLFLI